MSAVTKTESKPAGQLRKGLGLILCSVPLALVPLGPVMFLGVILFLAGSGLYVDGLVENQKWEDAKKQVALIAASTRE